MFREKGSKEGEAYQGPALKKWGSTKRNHFYTWENSLGAYIYTVFIYRYVYINYPGCCVLSDDILVRTTLISCPLLPFRFYFELNAPSFSW